MNGRRDGLSRRRFLTAVGGGVMAGACASAVSEAAPDAVSIGVIADAQYADQDVSGIRHYRKSLGKLEECVAQLNRHELACTLHLGDFIDTGFENFDAPLAIMQGLRAPCHYVLGNHDFSVAAGKKDHVPAKLGMKSRYYSFVKGAWRFIVLDGNDVGLLACAPGTPGYEQAQKMLKTMQQAGAANAKSWNGAVSAQQLDWLRGELKQTAGRGQKALVFCHFPVYPPNVHNLWNDIDLIAALDPAGCVAAYMNGHNHAGEYGCRKGIHYLTVHGMVDTADTTAYGVVTLHPDRLEVKGYGREPDRVLKLA